MYVRMSQNAIIYYVLCTYVPKCYYLLCFMYVCPKMLLFTMFYVHTTTDVFLMALVFEPSWHRVGSKTPQHESQMAPRRSKTAPGPPQDGPKRARRRPKMAPRRPKTTQQGPRRPQDRPKMAPRCPKMAPRCSKIAFRCRGRANFAQIRTKTVCHM